MSNPNDKSMPDTKNPQRTATAVEHGPLEDASTQALAEALRSSFRVVKLLMFGLVLIFIASGIFIVNPNEVVVLLRFGRPVGIGSEQLLKPGLHWSFPYPIDEQVPIPIGQSHTVVSTTGWYPHTPQEQAAGLPPLALPYLRPGIDGYTLSADGNIIHARATIKYRLQANNALNHKFNFANATNLIQNMLNNALIYASTHFTADAAIYRDKIAFSDLVRQRTAQLVDDLGLGITIETIDVETSAPLDVKPAFDEVLNAQQTARTKISEAETYARGATNAALAQASAILSDGLTRSNQVVKTVAAEAKSFSEQLPYYQLDPTLFKQRLLIETMQRVLTNAQEKFFVPHRADGKPRQLRLQISREPQKLKTE